jgi:hypothetical protein
MLVLAYGKARTGPALDNPVLTTEGRVTLIDGLLAVAVLLGPVLSAVWGRWWADPLAGYVIVRHRPRRGRAVLEQQIIIDQERHPLRDHRPVLDVPGPPAPRREETQDHERPQ